MLYNIVYLKIHSALLCLSTFYQNFSICQEQALKCILKCCTVHCSCSDTLLSLNYLWYQYLLFPKLVTSGHLKVFTLSGPAFLFFEVMNDFLKQGSSINTSLQARSPCLRSSLTHLLSKEWASALENSILQLQPETSKLFRIFQRQKFAMLTSQIKQGVTQREKSTNCIRVMERYKDGIYHTRSTSAWTPYLNLVIYLKLCPVWDASSKEEVSLLSQIPS